MLLIEKDSYQCKQTNKSLKALQVGGGEEEICKKKEVKKE